MKRFHAHIVVENLETSIDFYSKLFGELPTKKMDDYAKWMMDDPCVNFAISSRGHVPGVNHFGFQVDSQEELAELKRLAEAATPTGVVDQGRTACCYSNSEKHWAVDPQGVAWEHFYSISDAPEFNQDAANQDGACCIPVRGSDQNEEAACCIPTDSSGSHGACCE